MTIHQTMIRAAASPAEQRLLSLYQDAAPRLPGADFSPVREWRDGALDRFAVLGLPHRRIEEWKYTDLRSLMPEAFPLAEGALVVPSAALLQEIIGKSVANLDAYSAVFVDGRFQPALSTISDAVGVEFVSLGAALNDNAAATVAALPLIPGDAIAVMANAFATDGALITIAPGAKIDKPVHVISIAIPGTRKLYALQNQITVGAGADVTVIETIASPGEAQAIALTRLDIASAATVKHIRASSGDRAFNLSSLVARLGAGAQYDPVQMTVDGAVTRAQANIRFEGEGARCHYAGAMMLRRQSHCDFTLVVEHAAAGCESRELVKAVLDSRSRGVFQGKVIVERGAQKTDGKQMANALLLSDEAEFDSKPELEIYADDVACGHGATAGQLDDDMMFYLLARGIPELQARALLIAAFVGEALDKIESEPLRNALQEHVDNWLGVTL